MEKSPFLLPTIAAEGGLSRYMAAIKRYPLLTLEEERAFAASYAQTGDAVAAERLVASHLRLVAKIALKYRFYGLPVADLISEGNLGLLRAVRKFDVDKGFRLATYAVWWIRASINEYVLGSWSLVRIGTVAAQKKLFFNLLRLKSKLGAYNGADLTLEQTQWIAATLGVTTKDVVSMDQRMLKDASLNAPISEENDVQRIESLIDDRPNQEQSLGERQEKALGSRLLKDALQTLNERERAIIAERRLRSTPATLENLGQKYGISRERVRQIENRAFVKLQSAVTKAAAALGHTQGVPVPA